MGAWRKGGFVLIPELGRLISKIPIAVFIPRREIAFLSSRPFLIGPDPKNDPGISFVL